MTMRIDQARHQSLATYVHDLADGRGRRRAIDRHDAMSLDHDD